MVIRILSIINKDTIKYFPELKLLDNIDSLPELNNGSDYIIDSKNKTIRKYIKDEQFNMLLSGTQDMDRTIRHLQAWLRQHYWGIGYKDGKK